MRILLIVLTVCTLFLGSCFKKKDCGCLDAPPSSANKWKITQRSGSITGDTISLTDAQRNSILTLSPDATFRVKDTVSGAELSGTYATTSFASIYGQMPRIVFTPNLPMLSNEFHVLVNNQNGKFVLGDNVTDGYLTTFSIVQ